MPWREPTVVDLRYELVLKYFSEGASVSELASCYEVSRKTVYKWIKRFEAEGKSGLCDHSRAPRRCPHRIPKELAEILLKARRLHPNWGPRKILPWLRRRLPQLQLPAASTVGDLYKQHGLVRSRRRRRSVEAKIPARTAGTQPNAVWTIDYKGQFRTADRRYCYPLTIADRYSRYLLDIRALGSTSYLGARRTVERCFRENGLPEVIRSDNGVPFALPHALGGLGRLTVWWTRLGIWHERIEPGRPQQNGAHERMHKTLKQETVKPAAAKNHRSQQQRFDAFRHEFNFERPHESLENKTPSELWELSPRQYPTKVPLPEYPDHFRVRKVHKNGHFKFGGRAVFVGRALSGEYVGLEEIDDDEWEVCFCRLRLKRIHAHDRVSIIGRRTFHRPLRYPNV